MEDKCEWVDSIFVGCEKLKRSFPRVYGMSIGDTVTIDINNIECDFCPYCGADIRRPEPDPPSQEELQKRIDDTLAYLNCGVVHEYETIFKLLKGKESI